MAEPACAQRTANVTTGIVTTASNTTKTTVRIVLMDGIIHEAAVSALGHAPALSNNFRMACAIQSSLSRPIYQSGALSPIADMRRRVFIEHPSIRHSSI
ncbi:hypothetical protein [Vitreimonas flagellata]|uniref:hypothetical protein n=1 Tax=Vitreimonas flagellata TaxID=2560861 RepID=UPI0014301A11|nr:hypothetical protein [Vitreimonas flagellata]